MSKTLEQLAEKQEALSELHELIKPGDIVYTILRHVSSSGMTRHISLILIGEDKKPLMIDYLIVKALGYKRVPMNRGEGVIVTGCGMDMGFSVVYNLSSVLYPKGFECISPHGARCGANDHVNGVDTTHHKEGGYALEQRWM